METNRSSRQPYTLRREIRRGQGGGEQDGAHMSLAAAPSGRPGEWKGLTWEKDSVCLGGSRLMGLPQAPVPYAGKHRTPSQTWV